VIVVIFENIYFTATLLGVVGYLLAALLPIFRRICQWKIFENRPIFAEDIDKRLQLTFLEVTLYRISQ